MDRSSRAVARTSLTNCATRYPRHADQFSGCLPGDKQAEFVRLEQPPVATGDLNPVKVGAEWQIVFQIRNLAATYDAWGSERGAAPASTEDLKIIGGPIRVKYSVEPGELQGTG